MGKRDFRQNVIGSTVRERDKKSNSNRNNIYLKHELIPSKAKIFHSHKEHKVNITQSYKTEAFARL